MFEQYGVDSSNRAVFQRPNMRISFGRIKEIWETKYQIGWTSR